MEEVEAALELVKLTQLRFSREQTDKIIQSGKWDRVERHQNALKELAGEADQLKRKTARDEDRCKRKCGPCKEMEPQN